MAIKDIKIEPTDDLDLFRIRVQDGFSQIIKELNTKKISEVVSYNNNRITNLGDAAGPKDATNLQTVRNEITRAARATPRPTTPFRPRVQCHALTFGIVGTVTAGDDQTPHVECHIPALYQLEAYECWINSKVAVTGDSIYDVEFSTNSGTTWVSVFNTLPTLSSGNTELTTPHTDFASSPQVHPRDGIFRVNCDAAGGAEDVELVVRFYRIRIPPTLDRRGDLE